jgi:hypothetical protein
LRAVCCYATSYYWSRRLMNGQQSFVHIPGRAMRLFSGIERHHRPDGELLKLDIDFSISREGLRVDTVLFDASTDKARSNSIFTRIFGKLMELRAKSWVGEYVKKNAFYLPGSDNFLKNINSSEGIKRDDFMNLMISAKISRSPLFLRPTGNTYGLRQNYAFSNPESNLLDFFVKIIDPSLSKESVKTFFNFIDGEYLKINNKEIYLALEFLDKFRQWSEKNEDNEVFKKIKGSVNIFHSFISKKINSIELNNEPENLQKARKINSGEGYIKEAFENLVDREFGIELIVFAQDWRNGAQISGAEFLEYIKHQSCVINPTNIDGLKKWVEIDHQKFINYLPFHYQYLIPSLTVAANQLKIDIGNFESENYKKKLPSIFL